jgi:L-aminopeptidase/D-esterase-like protein
MVTAVEGVRVGHWTDRAACTGCTVVLFPEGTVASGEVRGGAPATREFELLRPERLVDRLDAVVLTGGSAFGLAAADGVMRFCEEHGAGFPTAAGVVPIVVALGVFDLLMGDPTVRPTAASGYHAARSATAGPVELGPVGVGAGCTVNKWRGEDARRSGGLVGHTVRHGELVVSALVAVNAFGDVDDGSTLADRLHRPGEAFVQRAAIGAHAPAAQEPGAEAPSAQEYGEQQTAPGPEAAGGRGNTTVGVVVTNARLDKAGCLLAAQGAHDGLARAVAPTHTRVDGDAFVAASAGRVDAPVDEVRFLAVAAVEAAIRSLP